MYSYLINIHIRNREFALRTLFVLFIAISLFTSCDKNSFNNNHQKFDVTNYSDDQLFKIENDSLKISLLLLKAQRTAEINISLAEHYLHFADSLLPITNQKTLTLNSFITHSYINTYKKEWNKSIQHISKFETDLEEISSSQFPIYFYCKGRYLEYKGEPDSAIELYQSIIGNLDQTIWEYALLNESKASLYMFFGAYEKALSDIKESIKTFALLNDSIGLATSIKIRGDIYSYQGDYNKAMKSFYESIAYIGSQNHPILLATVYNNIGNIYSSLDVKEKALVYFNKSLQIYESINNQKGIALTYNNIGVIYEANILLDSAMNYHKLSLGINDQINNYKGSAFALANIGSIYQKLNQPGKSIEYHKKSLAISTDRNDYEGIMVGHCGLGSAYLDMQNFSKAENHLLKSLKLSEEHGLTEYSSRNSKLLSTLYQNNKLESLALKYHKKYSNYLVQLQSYQLTEMETRFENVKKEEEINRLNFEKSFQQKRIDNLKIQFIIAVVFAIIILSFLIFYFRLFLVKKRALIDLADKNITIAKSQKVNQPLKKIDSSIDGEEKYSTSSMDSDLKNNLYEAIKIEFNTNKVYLNKELNLQKLSVILETNKMYVSQVISEKTGKHFNNYVNEYRINEARQLIIDGRFNNYTIQSIAEMAGFNSLSSFNKAFKKYTGITPSFFIKQVEIQANKGLLN